MTVDLRKTTAIIKAVLTVSNHSISISLFKRIMHKITHRITKMNLQEKDYHLLREMHYLVLSMSQRKALYSVR